jgi:hypothetical protein
MKKILKLKVSAWPLLGIVFVSAMIYSLVAYAQNTTLQQKQFNSLVSSGVLLTVNNQFQLIAGWDGTNARPILTTAAGALSASTVEAAKTSLATFQTNCGAFAGGTQLTSSAGKSVTITALAANTAPVYLAASAAGCTLAGGHELSQSASFSESFDNANRVFCCSATATQDISVAVTN